jgi:ABC-type transport system involved in multi-copper enzyme maturation permease subunit
MLLAVTVNDILIFSILGVVGLLLLGIALVLLRGLFQARSLLRKEFSAYFLSPVAYVMLGVFLAVLGCRFYLALDQLTQSGPQGIEFPMQYLFSILPRGIAGSKAWLMELFSSQAFWIVYLLIPPLLTMRLFAEERSTGTLEVLMTAPLKDWQVVLSKYLACFAFYVILWLPTLVYLPVLLDLQPPQWQPVWTLWSVLLLGGLGAIVLALLLALLPLGTLSRLLALVLLLAGVVGAGVGGWYHYHNDAQHLVDVVAGIDPMPVLSTYLGLVLAGAMFLAQGMLVSSLLGSQIVAALISVLLNLVIIVGGLLPRVVDTGGNLSQILYSFCVPLHISQDFGRGLIDTRHVVLYGSVALFCLFLTVRSLESRRWR